MKRLTKEELTAAHLIYNRVSHLTQNYYGNRTQDVVHKFVSENRWVMFPEYHFGSLREAVTYPVPNVYISFPNGVVTSDLVGRVDGWIGLTFNNAESMLWLNEILRVRNADFFISVLKGMDLPWLVEVQQKIKTNYKDNTPRYETIHKCDAPYVSAEFIKEAVMQSNEKLPKVGEYYQDEPVLWAVTVFSVSKKITTVDFDPSVERAFELFFRILSLR